MTLDFYSSSLSSIDSSLSYSLCPILLDLPSPPSDEPVINASLWERVEHGVALTYGWLPVHHDPPPRPSPLLFARLLRWPQVSLRVVAVVRFIKILGQPSSPHDHAHRPKPPPPPPPITRSRVRARAPRLEFGGDWRWRRRRGGGGGSLRGSFQGAPKWTSSSLEEGLPADRGRWTGWRREMHGLVFPQRDMALG